MGKVMVIDVSRCTGCYACYVACKDEHVDNDWSPYTKPMPDTGAHWLRIDERERGKTPYVKKSYIPILCQHCDNAPCIPACPVGAIEKRKTDGIVLINPDKCNGCIMFERPLCIDACPYGVIYFNKELKIAQKCTLCAHLLDGKDPMWKHGIPRCVDACHNEVFVFGEETDAKIKELIKKAEVLYPEHGTKPRVYYLNMPKPFIAGQVIDPAADEVVIGAKVTAKDLVSGKEYAVETDELGDFWLKELEPGHRYFVKITKDGYHEKVVGVVVADKDVSLGEVKIYRKG